MTRTAVTYRTFFGARELMHIFVGKRETSLIMLKILGANVQNLFSLTTRCPGCVHPCS